MSDRWEQRRAYAAWVILGLLAWCGLVVGGLITWGSR